MRVVMISTVGLALAAAGAAAAQAQGQAEVSRSFPVAPFTAIAVSGPYDVVVTTGRPAAVSARGTRRVVEDLVVEVKEGRLIIRPQNRGWLGNWGSGRSSARVSVSVPSLQAVSLAGSGDVSVDRVRGDRFSGSVAGSGDLSLGEVAVGELKLSVAGSGDVRAAGQARNADYSVAGSGDVDAGRLTSVRAAASVAGSGNVRARVTGEAKASLVGSGDIDITGGARCQQSRRGSGDIRCS
jgi:hypothetical protein